MDWEGTCTLYTRSADVVGLSERHALPNKVICQIRRKHIRRKCPFHLGGVDGERMEDPPSNLHDGPECVDGLEERGLVLLQVLVVRARETLKGDEEACESPQDSPCLPSYQLQAVWVLLLWHEATPGAVCIGKGDESELGGAVDDEVLSPATEVSEGERGGEEELSNVVTVTHSIKAILGGPIESKACSKEVAVYPERVTSQRSTPCLIS